MLASSCTVQGFAGLWGFHMAETDGMLATGLWQAQVLERASCQRLAHGCN